MTMLSLLPGLVVTPVKVVTIVGLIVGLIVEMGVSVKVDVEGGSTVQPVLVPAAGLVYAAQIASSALSIMVSVAVGSAIVTRNVVFAMLDGAGIVKFTKSLGNVVGNLRHVSCFSTHA